MIASKILRRNKMKPKGTETILSDENRLLKEKIKSLQAEVHNLEKNREVTNGFEDASKIIVGVIILICLYPLFRLGLLMLSGF